MKKLFPPSLSSAPFSSQQALKAGLTSNTLTRLVKWGVIERLSQGVYQCSESRDQDGESDFRAATLRCGAPSAVCLLSALEYYHLTDQISKKVWVLVPEEKRVRSIKIRVLRSRNPRWDIGIVKEKGYWITSIERTIIDAILYKKTIGFPVAVEALKEGVKKVGLDKIYTMAKKMEVEHRLYPYIEMVS